MLAAAFVQRASGLTFEIHNQEVITGAEDLAEMIIAVDTHSRAERSGIARNVVSESEQLPALF